MSKCTLEYTLPEDQEELDCALNGHKYKYVLSDIAQEVFRPARKHGYPDPRIQSLIEKLDEMVTDIADGEKAGDEVPPLGEDWPKDEYGPMNATDLVGLLEKLFHETITRQGVSLD